MGVILQGINYSHPDGSSLFRDINFTLEDGDKASLIGENGAGKSTLLRLISKDIQIQSDKISGNDNVILIPQLFGQYDHLKVMQVLGIYEKIIALKNIMGGHGTIHDYEILHDDWTIEERCIAAFNKWHVPVSSLDKIFGELSGGQQTRVMMAKLEIQDPGIILMDEPTNHLDREGREMIYDFILQCKRLILVVSHDRMLLESLSPTFELSPLGIRTYGGNYSFYKEEKEKHQQALERSLLSTEKMIKQAVKKKQESLQKQEKSNQRGEKSNKKKGVDKMMMNIMKGSGESTLSSLKQSHDKKIGQLKSQKDEMLAKKTGDNLIRLNVEDSAIHKNKIIVKAEKLNVEVGKEWLWTEPLSFIITGNERILLSGKNGSGKTTFIKLITGTKKPGRGKIEAAAVQVAFLDQSLSIISDSLTVLQQIQACNKRNLLEHELRNQLDRFLFPALYIDKKCSVLSGGERLRLSLCCLFTANPAPDLIILDEPTNNIDIRNAEILTNVMNQYSGALLVVSHDKVFQDEIHITREIDLDKILVQ